MVLKRGIESAVRRLLEKCRRTWHIRHFSSTPSPGSNDAYKLVIVGGGSGGCATAAMFSRKLGKGQVAVIEPKEVHSYQPMWTLVGAGLKSLEQSQQPMSSVLPSDCVWIKDSAAQFDPENNLVVTASGKQILYEYLVVAAGIQLNYNKIKGLEEALRTDPTVCSNYDARYVTKTFPALEEVTNGNAIFTLPNTPIKCAGAPQKIMYLAEEIFRSKGIRDNVNVIFNTALGVIFAVKKYANSLLEIIHNRNIKVNFRRNLVEVNSNTKEAIFDLLDGKPGTTESFKYSFLHVTPPMSAPDAIRASPLVNADGWVDLHKLTLQHTKFRNVFGIGDCTSLPTSKTAAAVAAQSGVLKENLTAVMNGEQLPHSYDGYTSCPLITGKNKCILAEFDYDAKPLETFPVDQSIERWTMYQMKAQAMPEIYWRAMLKGHWHGPAVVRKILHLGLEDRAH